MIKHQHSLPLLLSWLMECSEAQLYRPRSSFRDCKQPQETPDHTHPQTAATPASQGNAARHPECENNTNTHHTNDSRQSLPFSAGGAAQQQQRPQADLMSQQCKGSSHADVAHHSNTPGGHNICIESCITITETRCLVPHTAGMPPDQTPEHGDGLMQRPREAEATEIEPCGWTHLVVILGVRRLQPLLGASCRANSRTGGDPISRDDCLWSMCETAMILSSSTTTTSTTL